MIKVNIIGPCLHNIILFSITYFVNKNAHVYMKQ